MSRFTDQFFGAKPLEDDLDLDSILSDSDGIRSLLQIHRSGFRSKALRRDLE